MADLEKRLNGYDNPAQQNIEYTGQPKERKDFYERARDSLTNYIVDVSAGWTFFTPTYAAMEYLITGMSSEEVLKSRLAGLVAHSIAMRPTGLLRNKLAKKWGVTKQSRFYKKWAVNACAQTPIQAVLYTSMLLYSGASPEEISVALPLGLAIAFPLSEPFGRWMDRWRKVWGKEAAIK